MAECCKSPVAPRRKGLLGKLKNVIDHLDDKPNAPDPCHPGCNNGCPGQSCGSCFGASAPSCCGPRCGACFGNGCSMPCYKNGPCCGPAAWSPYCPPTVVMPAPCCSACGPC